MRTWIATIRVTDDGKPYPMVTQEVLEILEKCQMPAGVTMVVESLVPVENKGGN